MSEQENNKMEAWLKAYRQKRLDQWNEDPVELDEPTRAMLMAEVRRQKTVAPLEAPSASEPTLSWLRWALGGMTAAIVVLGVTSLSNFKSDPDTMARAENTASEVEGETAIGIADAPAEQSNRDTAKAVAEGGEDAAVGGFEPSVSGTVQAVPSQVVPTHPVPRPEVVRNVPVRQNVKMANGNYYNNAREMQLNFAQQTQTRARSDIAAPRMMAKQKEMPKPVLVNFELKRVGKAIRVVDGDGSVYTGTVINEEAVPEAEEPQMTLSQPGAGLGGGGAGPANLAAAKPGAKMRRGSQAFFRVQGTNKTLKQMVVLEATLDNSAVAFTATKNTSHPASVTPRQPGGTVSPKKDEGAKSLNHNLSAIRAINRMRVLGNARIGKEDFAVDAYLDTRAAGENETPADTKKK
ncbi:hypothetical protein OAJ79_02095 [Verrucomicrobia bacterium]|nr:hypothetical protein [Verrucomicrobiota bacterium]